MNVTFDATISDTPTQSGDYVLRRGKIFNIGSWPERGFSLSAEEARAAVENFQACDADLDHKQTVLSGKLGALVKVEFDGHNLIGTLKEPRWFADLLGDAPRKVSCHWNMAKKRLVGIAHTLTPAIPDAAVFAAFSASTANDPEAVDWDEVNRALTENGFKPKDNA